MATLSIILPAYNEAKRLPPYLAEIRLYFGQTPERPYELLVVDDGSVDHSAPTFRCLASDWPQLLVLQHRSNLGKGAAIRTGMLAATGELFLVADADGATPIEEEGKLWQAIDQGAHAAVGSRHLADDGAKRVRVWRRDMCGRLFSRAVQTLFHLKVRDTQCGFKMFRREVALRLLDRCREQGYLLDLELLAWASRLGYRTAEVPVSWREVPGSKVHLVRDGLVMLHGLARLGRSLATRIPSQGLAGGVLPSPRVLSTAASPPSGFKPQGG